MKTVPADFPVQPLAPGAQAKDRMTCGTCGRSWDDAIATGWTPAPAGRCPFEYFHGEPLPDKRAFLDAFGRVLDMGPWSALLDPMFFYDTYREDAEAMRADLSNAISETLSTLGIDEPEEEGGSLEWLATLHDWIEEAYPDIGECLALSTDYLEEED